MNYNVRINDNFLKADHSDGEVLQHTDLNELESVVKTAINANYVDIQKLQNGTTPVSNANSLKGASGSATLSQAVSEILVPSDNKIPSSLQVKNFVDNTISTFSSGLVFYWNGTEGQEGADIFNQVCAKYDAGEKFIFYGKISIQVPVQTGIGDTYSYETRYLIMPITVSKITNNESYDYSFSVPSIYCGYFANYISPYIRLTGTWGNYTNVTCGSMEDYMTPITKSQLDGALFSEYLVRLSGDYSSATADGVSLTEEDAQKLRVKTSNAMEGALFRIDLNINGTVHLFGEVTNVHTRVYAYYATIDCTSLGVNSNIKATINIYFTPSDTDPDTWITDTERTKLYVSTL